jgi:hypothetical protein
MRFFYEEHADMHFCKGSATVIPLLLLNIDNVIRYD